jgi:hypothetical protein
LIDLVIDSTKRKCLSRKWKKLWSVAGTARWSSKVALVISSRYSFTSRISLRPLTQRGLKIGVLQGFYPQAAKPGKNNVSFQLSKTGTNSIIDPSHFFNDSAREINVDDLTQSALKAFSIIEPWYQAKTS